MFSPHPLHRYRAWLFCSLVFLFASCGQQMSQQDGANLSVDSSDQIQVPEGFTFESMQTQQIRVRMEH
ncbi:MAG: hypothetical protein AAGJ35_14165, partial [Myxococcota bacterium]